MSFNIHGNFEQEFLPVYDHFHSLFERGFDKNSQLCIYVGDRKVVDLCGTNGEAKMMKGQEYGLDTCQAVYSSGKSVASILIAKMVDEGKIQFEDKIA